MTKTLANGAVAPHALSDSKFRGLLEATSDAMVIVNKDGEIVLLNSRAEKLFGYERDELLGRPVELLVPQRFRRRHPGHRMGYNSEITARGMGVGLEIFGMRKDGSEFPAEINLNPLEAEGGLISSSIRDITQRKLADAMFRGLLESATDAIVIVNKNGKIVLANSQTERLFGYDREELVGKTVDLLVPRHILGPHPDKWTNYISETSVSPMGTEIDLQGLRKDGGKFPVEISLSPIETEEGVLVSNSIRDVTERRRFEQTLKEKNIELENASLAKDRFLASMSHELRTPLNAIIGFTGTLLMRLPGPLTAEQEKQLRTVQTSGRHLLSLINDLLDLAKIESGNVAVSFDPVVIQNVVGEVASALRPQAEAKGLRFEVTAPRHDLVVMADRRALSQILFNLTNNAIKFTEKGSVTIEIAQRAAGRFLLTEITISDSGVGIRAEDQEKLFQAFIQVDGRDPGRSEGTGLGLHLSQKLASLVRGVISCESTFGKGSRFTLTMERVP
jgi:PAS domain S-box-containing protein